MIISEGIPITNGCIGVQMFGNLGSIQLMSNLIDNLWEITVFWNPVYVIASKRCIPSHCTNKYCLINSIFV